MDRVRKTGYPMAAGGQVSTGKNTPSRKKQETERIHSIFIVNDVFTGIAMDESDHFTIKELIFTGDQDPGHNAIESPSLQPLTYRDLRQQILYVVKTLNAGGFQRNDRIAVITPAGPETAVIIISVMAGFTSVPLNPLSRGQEYDLLFSELKIKAIIVQKGYFTAATDIARRQDIAVIELLPLPGLAGRFTLEPAGVEDSPEARFATPSDISHIFLTSGTTARPKIVPLTQKQSFLGRRRQVKALQMTSADRCLHISPYYHGMGLHTALMSILFAGGTVICTKDFISPDFFFLLNTFRPTCYVAGPAQHQGILREMKKIPPDERKNNSLRLIVSSSASLPAGLSQELKTLLGVAVTEQYALSETGVISINIPQRQGSVGVPVIEQVAIMDHDDTFLRVSKEGEIIVKGDTLFSGYEDAPDENKAAFINGWFRTGDLGYQDEEGYLFITGRKKELINKGGRKISPVEIDAILRSHPCVSETMVFPVHDPALGEDIAAIVVPSHKTVTEADLRMFLLDRLDAFKVPKRIYFVDAIPRNPAGKPLRQEGTRRFSPGH